MKTNTQQTIKRVTRCFAALLAGCIATTQSVQAANITKANTDDNLDQGAAWTGGTPPTAADVAIFNSTISTGPSAGSWLLGVDTNWAGILLSNPGTNVVIGAGGTLTLGTAGIDLSAATTNLTLQCAVNVGATQTWNVASGRALIINGAVSGTNGFIKSGAGVLGLSVANTWTNGTVVSNGVISLDATVASLGVNAIGHTVTLAGGAISNNWGTGNQVTHNNSIVVPAGTTGTIKLGNRIRLASNGNAATISGGGTLNIVASSTVTRDDIGSQAGPFTGTVNFVNEVGFAGQAGFRFFINAGSFSGFSNAVVNLDGNQAWNYNCNSGGNTFTYGALQGTNSSAVIGFLSAGNFPRIVVGTLNTDSTLAAQFANTAASLFKAGTGALTLTANHAHTLSNWVQSGRIIFVTGGSSSNASQTVVANTAGIGILVSPNAAQWVGTNFIYGPGTNRLEFNLGGSTPSTTVAPLLIRGNLALNSSNLMVGIVGGNWSVGQYPLVKYGTLSGAPGFAAVTLTNQPARVLGYLSNNTLNASIDYVVTNSTQPLSWATGNGTWDISSSVNWVDASSAATTYQEVGGFGDSVRFEDTASVGNPITVTLNTTVSPINVTHSGAKNFTISGAGAINGLASIVKSGSGTLTLGTANTFTGGANLNAGTVSFSALNNLGALSSPINFGGGTLQYASGNTTDISGHTVKLNAGGGTIDTAANNVSYANAIGAGGAGGLTKTGSGTLTLSGANNYSGNTVVSQGTLALATGATISSSASISVSSGATLSAASGLALNGAVSQSLSGSGTVQGSVTNAASTSLQPGSSVGTLVVAGSLAMTGGTYVYDVSTNSGRDLIVVSNDVALSSGTIQVNVTGTLTNGTYTLIKYSGTLASGAGSSGNLLLTGFVQAGKLALLSDATPGQIDLVVQTVGGKSITWAGVGADWDVEASFNWLQGIVSTQYVNGDFVTFNDGGVGQPSVNLTASLLPGAISGVAVNSTGDYTFSSGVGGRLSGSAGIIKNNTGKLTILTANNNTGGLTVNGGTVQVGDGGTTGDIGTGNVTNNSALVFQQTDNRTVSGAVRGTGSLTQNGQTTLTLNGVTAYTGSTTVGSGATLQVGNGGVNGAMSTSSILDDGRVILNSSSSWTAPAISGGGELIKAGTGTLTLAAANTYAGNTYISNGVVKISAGASIPSTGWTILDGSATVAGRLDLNGFDCTVGSLAGLGSTVSGQIVNNTGTATNILTVNESVATTYAGTIADNSGTGGKIAVTKIGAAALSLTGNNTYSGGTYVAEGTLNFGNTGAGTGQILLTNGVTLNSLGFNGNDVRTKAGSTVTVSTTVSEGSNGYGGNHSSEDSSATNSIVGVTSWGTANVKQFQNFTGTVRIESGSSIRYASTTLSVNGGDNTLFEVLGTLKTRNGTGNGEGIAVGALTGSGIVSAGASGGNVRMNIGARGMNTEFSGQMTGTTPNTLDVRKVGAGTLTLSGTLAYDGFTTVSNGVLALAGAANLDNSPALTVNSGATLDVSGIGGTLNLGNVVAQTLSGSGTVAGGITQGATSTISPGIASIGTLTASGLVSLSGATLMDLNRTNTPATNDMIAASSFVVNPGATITVTNLGPDLVTGDKFKLFSSALPAAFTTVNLPTTNATGTITYVWQNKLTVDGTIVVLSGASAVNPNPTNITSTVTGGGTTLTLTWPTSHTGWTLQAQTNALSVGVSGTWFNVPGSATTNQVIVPIVPGNPTVFYRLKL